MATSYGKEKTPREQNVNTHDVFTIETFGASFRFVRETTMSAEPDTEPNCPRPSDWSVLSEPDHFQKGQ